MPTPLYMEILPANFLTNYLHLLKNIVTKIHINSQALCVEKAVDYQLC